MKLVLLGTSGYHPTDRRQTACLMLPEVGVVLDAGTGMYRVAERLTTEDLSIFLTHPHLDHVIGLTYLFSLAAQRPLGRVIVYGKQATLDTVEQLLFAPAIFPVRPPFETRPLPDEAILPDGGRLTHFPLQHPGGATGFRLDWPTRSLAYVTDTTARPDADYLEQVRGVDVLVHECFFPDTMPREAELTGHSCITPVAELARAAGVGRLILTHLSPVPAIEAAIDPSAAQKIFPATEIGHDGLEIEF